jgi:hypothetical protein
MNLAALSSGGRIRGSHTAPVEALYLDICIDLDLEYTCLWNSLWKSLYNICHSRIHRRDIMSKPGYADGV